jgi:hypothetical protein
MNPSFTAEVVVVFADGDSTFLNSLRVDTPDDTSFANLRTVIREAARSGVGSVDDMITHIHITELLCPSCGMSCLTKDTCGCTDDCERHGTEIGKALRLIQDAVKGCVASEKELQAAYDLIYKHIYP